ncbi:MAG: hypothetical protein IJ377_04860 [Rikenellaceae bacterium]|nr:hypothetical protein [Rikenellaceae bacterium]
MRTIDKLFVISLLALTLAGCRDNIEPILLPDNTIVTYPDPMVGDVKGFFLLNEGNMGSNKASLDYFDYETGEYSCNIFPQRNPNVVKELGDVGNDLQVYGERLYAVINCSNLVEVMNLSTAEHIGAVSIANCRYITFDKGFAYVSSYAGPVQIDPNARPGKVVKIDTATLSIVGECVVGYQPEEMAVVGDRLYVANSGGYRVPNYDTTVSVIDLETFTELKRIEVAINLHRLELDRYGYLWVSSRGDYYSKQSALYAIDTRTDQVATKLDLPVGNMTRLGDSLYVYSNAFDKQAQKHSISYAIVNLVSREVVDRHFIKDGTESQIVVPYGVAVNPETRDILVTDAGDYVTPGKLHCYNADGVRQWSVTTGDIPAHIAFTHRRLKPTTNTNPDQNDTNPYITSVFDYRPAVGQFVNELPKYEAGDTQEKMNAKVLAAIGNNARSQISLGGYGGYVVVGFDHTIPNVSGLRDFRVLGNAFYSGTASPTDPIGGSSEPGIIMVARDANGNGLPDDEWYEIAGSAHRDVKSEAFYPLAQKAGLDVAFYTDYQITYYRPTSEPDEPTEQYIRWTDNKQGEGYMVKNEFHLQSYFPQWIDADSLVFSGTRLPQNGIDTSGKGTNFVLYKFGYGYADNDKNTADDASIDIDWAVDSGGKAVTLSGIDFVKIYSGVNQQNGWIGENSTEVCGVEDLHALGERIATR